MSTGAQRAMAVTRVACGDTMHDSPERLLSHLDQGMHMVRHPAKRVYARSAPLEHSAKERIQVTAIEGVSKSALRNDCRAG
jgi:hypothetical protein